MSSTGSDPECDFLGFGWVRGPSAFRTPEEEALAIAEAAETATAQVDTNGAATVSPAAGETVVVASPEVVMHYLAVARNALAAANPQRLI